MTDPRDDSTTTPPSTNANADVSKTEPEPSPDQAEANLCNFVAQKLDGMTTEDSEDEDPEDSNDEDESGPFSFGDLFANALNKRQKDHNLDDASLLTAYYETVLQKEEEGGGDGKEEEKEEEEMSVPSRGDLTAWVLKQYRDAGMKYYPEEVKAQVRLLLLAYYTMDEVDDPADDPVMVKLVKEVWSSDKPSASA